VDKELIPAGIKTRLFVSITDPDWKERIMAAIERRSPTVTKPQVEPYALIIHQLGEQYAIEVRPRAGTWSPFMIGIPMNEKDRVSPHLHHGAAYRPPTGIIMTSLHRYIEGTTADGKLWINSAGNEATPTQSYYILCQNLPSFLIFGIDDGSPQYKVKL
jgi:hypothetical protein